MHWSCCWAAPNLGFSRNSRDPSRVVSKLNLYRIFIKRGVNRFADRRICPVFTPRLRILSINMLIRGFEKHRGSRISWKIWPGLRTLSMSKSSDYGLDHWLSVGLWFRYFCVLSTIFVNFKFYSTERGIALFQNYNQIFRFFQIFRQKWGSEVLRRLVHFTFPFPPPSGMLGFVRYKLLVGYSTLIREVGDWCAAARKYLFRGISVTPLKTMWHGSNSQIFLTTSVSMVVDRASTFLVGVSSQFGRQALINSNLSIN